MKREFVTYEIALNLKELGFNMLCFACFDTEKEIVLEMSYNADPNLRERGFVAAPLWQQATRWLMEYERIFVSINSWTDHGRTSFGYEIYRGDSSIVLKSSGDGYGSEKEALAEAINVALRLGELSFKIISNEYLLKNQL